MPVPTLKEALKELYDGFVEENRSPAVTRQGSLSVSQNEAAQLYAAAVARASGARPSGTSQPSVQPPVQPMSSRLVVTPDERPAAPVATSASVQAASPDILNVLANLTPNQVIQGIVLSEILGKPVSRRKGSNRIGR